MACCHQTTLPLRRSRSRGFSLAEVLVVLLILAIGSSIALYSYSGYRNALTTESTARKVQALLTTARSQALALDTQTEVVLDLDTRTFWMNVLPSGAVPYQPKAVREEAASDFVVIEGVRLGGQLPVSSGQVIVTFQPDGRGQYLALTLRREFDDPTDDASYTSLQMFPHGVPEITEKDRL